jgi:hypothetical protein
MNVMLPGYCQNDVHRLLFSSTTTSKPNGHANDEIKNETTKMNDVERAVRPSVKMITKNHENSTEDHKKKKKKTSMTMRIDQSDEDMPMVMPKQHQPMKKSMLTGQRAEQLIDTEHYQSPPIDDADDDYRPPLPPKQRHQNDTSRALVYDFIGSELQELRETLARFDTNSSRMLSIYVNKCCT